MNRTIPNVRLRLYVSVFWTLGSTEEPYVFSCIRPAVFNIVFSGLGYYFFLIFWMKVEFNKHKGGWAHFRRKFNQNWGNQAFLGRNLHWNWIWRQAWKFGKCDRFEFLSKIIIVPKIEKWIIFWPKIIS